MTRLGRGATDVVDKWCGTSTIILLCNTAVKSNNISYMRLRYLASYGTGDIGALFGLVPCLAITAGAILG
jgi:hypothetical protein